MVYYRKYRPQTIKELDSEQVCKALSALVSSPQTPHAFLFMGPKGLGKTSAARILAKIVNCEERWEVRNGKLEKEMRSGKGRKSQVSLQNPVSHVSRHTSNIEPCNKCSQCISITNGTNLDVLEIDGASNRGIDEIRDLREKIKLAPFSAKKKVYIIDEVHMLTTEAFNALLKTLEEPPPHALFILATTEVYKVPQTIVSRCFVVNFEKPTTDELLRSLERIVKNEKIDIEKEALIKICNLSNGSFRDGAKLLEQLQSESGAKKITEKLVEELHHVSDIESGALKLIEFLGKKDAASSLKFLNSEVAKGISSKHLLEKLLEKLHEMLIAKVVKEEGDFTIDELQNLLKLMGKAAGDMKYAVIAQLPIELAIVEWCIEGGKWEVGPEVRSEEKRGENKTSPPTQELLQQLIEKVKPLNYSIAGVLRGCSLKEYDNNKLTIETAYGFHKDRLSEKKVLEILEKTAEEIVGKKITVLVQLK